jgi:beta-glucosidase
MTQAEAQGAKRAKLRRCETVAGLFLWNMYVKITPGVEKMDNSFKLGGIRLGAATAATQIEGCDRNNSWYEWHKLGWVKDDPNTATQHWKKWKEDTRLMAEIGLQCSRMGLEWSRIEPKRGVFSEKAIARYRAELTMLRDLGIKPMVTLWHFSNPIWFEDRGAFLWRGAEKAFLEYVERVVADLGDLVESWITLNEPNVYAVNGYNGGNWPPGDSSIFKTLKVMNALVPCHIGAYNIIHGKFPDARVGFALHARVFDPKDPKNLKHAASARLSERLFQTALTEAMYTGKDAFPIRGGGKPGRYYDFHAVNYYTRSTCTGLRDGVRENTPKNDLGWEIYPEGICRVVRGLTDKYDAPVYITENGTCDNTDSFRCRYIYDHLKALSESGLPVERYYHWCFCDNFEWLEGFSARFGLIHTDYASQKRTIKKSGRFYSEIIQNGGVTQEMFDEYVAGEQYHVR